MQDSNLRDNMKILGVSVITGIGAGLLAALLKTLLKLMSRLFRITFDGTPFNIELLWLPVAGFIFASLYQRYALRQKANHGTRRIIEALKNTTNPLIKARIIAGSILGCVLTVGFGGSAGCEGPVALSGAALGNNLARHTGLDSKWVRIMIGIGAAAGIAGIFKSPVGGAFYALEILKIELSTLPVLTLFFACILASTTAFAISGFIFDTQFHMETAFNPMSLGWIVILGVVCGLYAIYYNWLMHRTAALLDRIPKHWMMVISSGVFTGLAILLIPALFGEGDSVITALINNLKCREFEHSLFNYFEYDKCWLFVILGLILLSKGALVASANTAGIAGVFIPALYIGAILGYSFGFLLSCVSGIHIEVWYMALAGMGAVLGATSKAPLMAIFILCETTNTYQFMPAYLIVVTVSYATCRFLPKISRINNNKQNNPAG